MNLNIDLLTSHCNLNTKDLTEVSDSGNGYLPESSVVSSKNRFKYSDTVSVHIFTYNKVDSTKNETYMNIISHTTLNDLLINSFKYDGYVVYNYIVIPTKEWVDKHPEEMSNYILGVYYSDGINLYKKTADTEELIILISDLLEITDDINSSISRIDNDIVVICNLKDCYLNYCNLIFNNKFSICYSKNQDKDLLYKRDLVWMALNVIDFLSEKQEFMAVLGIIERLFNCTGLCMSKKILGNDCGCS